MSKRNLIAASGRDLILTQSDFQAALSQYVSGRKTGILMNSCHDLTENLMKILRCHSTRNVCQVSSPVRRDPGSLMDWTRLVHDRSSWVTFALCQDPTRRKQSPVEQAGWQNRKRTSMRRSHLWCRPGLSSSTRTWSLRFVDSSHSSAQRGNSCRNTSGPVQRFSIKSWHVFSTVCWGSLHLASKGRAVRTTTVHSNRREQQAGTGVIRSHPTVSVRFSFRNSRRAQSLSRVADTTRVQVSTAPTIGKKIYLVSGCTRIFGDPLRSPGASRESVKQVAGNSKLRSAQESEFLPSHSALLRGRILTELLMYSWCPRSHATSCCLRSVRHEVCVRR